MSKKPVLVIMAAGMGSRYGGLKQIDPGDKEGHIIMDFSIYDAKQAGFEKVISEMMIPSGTVPNQSFSFRSSMTGISTRIRV